MFLFLTLHVMANLVWIGSITCVGWLLSSATRAAKANDVVKAQTTAELGAQLYRRVATPAFAMSFVFGVARVVVRPEYYLQAHWFHGKVTFALVVIALHHVIGAKTKRAASGGVQPEGSSAILTAALLVAALGTVVFAIYKSQLVR